MCRYPDKERYSSRRHAKQAIKRQLLRFRGTHMSAYRCEDHFHVGRLNEFVVSGHSLDRVNAPIKPTAD